MTLAGPQWDRLSQGEKDDYSRKAKEMRGLESGPAGAGSGRGGGGAMDSHGRSLQLIEERDREAKLLAEKKMMDVDKLVVQDKNGNLEGKTFYVLHATVFSKVSAFSENWVPAEIAVAKFSLSSGLIQAYQAFPLPGKLPLGSNFECRQQAEKLQVPLTPEDSSFNKKDVEIFEDLRAFLGSTNICFVMPELEAQVSGVLDRIARRSNLPSLGLSYLSLPRLLFKLRTALCRSEEEVIEALPTENLALRALETGKFLYSGGLGCDHHEQVDTAKCCQTAVASWVFTILDLCCPAFNLEMIPGRHSPAKPTQIKPVIWKAESSSRR